MSTRSAVVRPTGDSWSGRYIHWDGYPSGVGKDLFDLFNGHFKSDPEAFLKALVDDHPAGFSVVAGDWTQTPGYGSKGPECYCHGNRAESAQEITPANAADCGCEYVYLINPSARTMTILSSYNPNGHKMIGMFGSGNPDAQWSPVETISLDGPAPDWAVLDEKAG